jgi:hypothetical protein
MASHLDSVDLLDLLPKLGICGAARQRHSDRRTALRKLDNGQSGAEEAGLTKDPGGNPSLNRVLNGDYLKWEWCKKI